MLPPSVSPILGRARIARLSRICVRRPFPRPQAAARPVHDFDPSCSAERPTTSPSSVPAEGREVLGHVLSRDAGVQFAAESCKRGP
jgi:hypothetical protein